MQLYREAERDILLNMGSTCEVLQEIVSMVDNASDQVRAIATASEDQSATSEEITRSVHEINGISGDTAKAMTNSAKLWSSW